MKIRLMLAGLFMTTSTMAADYFGALAIDVKSGDTGYAVDYGSKGKAEKAALSACKKANKSADKCETVYTFWNSCAAIAWSATTGVYDVAWAEEKTSFSEMVAINRCNNNAGTRDCVVQAHVCTSREVVYYQYY